MEVEARFKADMENKNFMQTIGYKVMEEISSLKKELEATSNESKMLCKDFNRII